MADLEVASYIDNFMAAANEAAACVVLGAPQLAAANIFSVNGAASTPAAKLTGSWFTGGSATTTKPQLLVEPSGATSTGWNTNGTGIGVNGASGFGGNLIDAQLNGAARFYVAAGGTGYISGNWNVGGILICSSSLSLPNSSNGVLYTNGGNYALLSLAPTVNGDYTTSIFNSTNACKFHVFRTRTDASNYERLALQSGSGYFELAAETAGTGTDNIAIRLKPAGTGAARLCDSAGNDIVVALLDGSSKLGFFGATPVVLQATTGTTTGFTAGGGTAVLDDSTFTGNTGGTAYTIGDIVLALKNYGLLTT